MTQNKINSQTPFLQFVSSQTGTSSTISATIPADDTIPQNTEGTEVLTVTITPKSSTSILHITYSANMSQLTASGNMTAALFQDSNANALAAKCFGVGTSAVVYVNLQYIMTSGTTSSTTFKIRVGPSANTIQFLGAATGQLFGGVNNGTLVVKEYL